MPDLDLRRNTVPDAYRPPVGNRQRGPGGKFESREQAARRAEEERKAAIVEDGLAFFKLVSTAEREQREQELEDLKFDRGHPEDIWIKEIYEARKGGIDKETGRYIPPRPTLTISRIDQPVQQVVQEIRAAKFGITIKARGRGATKAKARLRQELYRAIDTDSRAHLHRLWAANRAVVCGRGFYRILKQFSNDGDFDQDIVIAGIENQHSVYFDPFADITNPIDAERCLITSDLPWKTYKRRYPRSRLASYSSDQLTGLGDSVASWVSGSSDDERTVRIAEFFYVVHEEKILVELEEGATAPDGTLLPQYARLDELDEKYGEGAVDDFVIDQRIVPVREVKWCVINAIEVLDEEDWDGRYIPVVPVIGKKYNVNGQKSYQGVVFKSKDSVRSYCVMRSEQTIAVGMVSKSPWIMAEGQDEGYEQQWDEANQRYFTRLTYKPTTFEGQLVPPPQRANMAADIGALTQLARESEADVRATTGREMASLGQISGERSGKAIRELKVQGEQTTGIYAENLANMAMPYEGRVVLDLMKHVYTRVGRNVRLMGEGKESERAILLGVPFKRDEDGEPVPVGPDEPREVGGYEEYRLDDDGDYDCIVAVGKNDQTVREEEAAFMGQLAEAVPQAVPQFMDLWVESASESPAAQKIVERLRKMNPNLNDESDQAGAQKIPPQVMARMKQLEQAFGEARQMVQQLQQQIATEEAKAKAMHQTKAAEIASRERIAQLQIKADLMKKRAELEAEKGVAYLDGQIALLEQEREHDHELNMKTLEVEITRRNADEAAARSGGAEAGA